MHEAHVENDRWTPCGQKRSIDIRNWIADNLSRRARLVMPDPTAYSETAFQLTAAYGLSERLIGLTHAVLSPYSNRNDF
jgi:hypothetical protein